MHPLYAAFARQVPAIGESVSMPDGEAVVLAHSLSDDSVVLRMSANGQVSPCHPAAVCGARQAYEGWSMPLAQPTAGPSQPT